MELQFKGTSDKDSSMDYMLLQGVRFAFRIHQVCLFTFPFREFIIYIYILLLN